MKSKWSVGLGAFVLLIVGVVPRGEQQTPPPAQPPAAGAPAQPPAQAGRGGRGGGIEAEIAAGADFSPRPPVTRLDPAAQQKLFLLPPGLQDRARPDRPADRGSGRRHLRRQRPDVRARDALLHAGRRRIELARADQPHLAARGHRRRRHVRQAHRVRRQDGHAAHRVSARRRRHPRARDRQPRHVQVHRHQR